MSRRVMVKLVPQALTDKIIGPMTDGTLKVSVTAPPIDDRANKALIRLLSREWRIPTTRLRIVRGGRSRKKIIEIL